MRSLYATLAALLPCLVFGQMPLTPAWVHTWPFGSDTVPYHVYTQSSADNHIAVDPITGHVHVTIDDQQQLASPHFNFLYSFLPNGDELTQVPTPLLGNYTGAPFGQNVEGLRDIVVRDDVRMEARELNLEGLGSGSVGNLVISEPNGNSWRLGLGNSGFQMLTLSMSTVIADDQGIVFARGFTGLDPGLHAIGYDGMIQWSKTYAGISMIQDCFFLGNEIIIGGYQKMARIDRSSGDMIALYEIYTAGEVDVPMQMATDGTRVYIVHGNYDGEWTLECLTVDGQQIWSSMASLGGYVREMAVDAQGRPWYILNKNQPHLEPLLVVTEADGSAYQTYTYGATMMDIAMDGQQAYITGRLDTSSTSTYLIALGADLMTTTEESAMESPIRLYPQPASTSLTIANVGRLEGLVVRDATGKTVHVALRNNTTLDVSRLSEGVYFLQAATVQGAITRRFAVSR